MAVDSKKTINNTTPGWTEGSIGTGGGEKEVQHDHSKRRHPTNKALAMIEGLGAWPALSVASKMPCHHEEMMCMM